MRRVLNRKRFVKCSFGERNCAINALGVRPGRERAITVQAEAESRESGRELCDNVRQTLISLDARALAAQWAYGPRAATLISRAE